MNALANKTALVTGGVRGIGASITRTLAEAGAQVIACYHTPGDHIDVLEKELATIGGEHHLVLTDVTDPDQVIALAQTCRERFGKLDVVVNNAGAISHVPFAELPLAEWHRVIDTGLTAAFHPLGGLLAHNRTSPAHQRNDQVRSHAGTSLRL
ncbi:SDR family NAD(P)-dependent oxidoreductase, partial [Nocardia iowensis]|uniref:SDR family NAD(P)-dependent oxidoreductase n=1 Tax=Nocardia iowensis TaxID=204891 RepID=UPI0037163613